MLNCNHGNDPWDVCRVCNPKEDRISIVSGITGEDLLDMLSRLSEEELKLRILIGNNCCTSQASTLSTVELIDQPFLYLSNKPKGGTPNGAGLWGVLRLELEEDSDV